MPRRPVIKTLQFYYLVFAIVCYLYQRKGKKTVLSFPGVPNGLIKIYYLGICISIVYTSISVEIEKKPRSGEKQYSFFPQLLLLFYRVILFRVVMILHSQTPLRWNKQQAILEFQVDVSACGCSGCCQKLL